MSKPMIRFEGFSDEWEQGTFGELVNIRRGLTYKPKDVVDSESGIRVLRSSNICGDTYKEHVDDVFVDVDAVNVDFVKNRNILVTTANGSPHLVGKHAIIEGVFEPVVHGGFMALIESDKPYFINSWMSSDRYRVITNMAQGGNGSIGNLSPKNMVRAKLYIPSKEEQELIGNIFKTIDDLISTQEETVEGYELYKEAMLQKMFLKKGQVNPDLRFKGFDGDWEEKKFSNVIESSSERSDGNEGYPVLTSSRNGIYLQSEYFDKILASKDTTGYRLLHKNHFTYRSMSDDGRFTFNRNDIVDVGLVSPAYPVFYINKKHASDFILRLMNYSSNIKENIHINKQGGTRLSLRIGTLKSMYVLLPSLEEQTLIGNFFKTLDETIEGHQVKLDQYKEMKESFLQKMFI